LHNSGRKAIDLVRGRQIVQGDEVEEFWALKNVSFDVAKGEVVGIIGRNGAGKSTLLKILSRITEPTQGRIVLRGRVASLREVGTGFHPELSGRENSYLNGGILGMRRSEIRQKFDEIVAFAEVEKFLDTPVKHYSSGMYVRLAFAVAAHLEPEILIVDEVLAVGDAEFQRKCLGKVSEVSSRQGRTVLFVSHNMEAVLKLCNRGIFLAAGEIIEIGKAPLVVERYLKRTFSRSMDACLTDSPRPYGPPKRLRLSRASVLAPQSEWVFPFDKQISFDLWVESAISMAGAELGIGLYSAKGYEIASWSNACSGDQLSMRPGPNALRVSFEDLTLLPGQYFLGIGIRSGAGRDFEDYVPEAILFDVVANERSASLNTSTFRGALIPHARVSQLPVPTTVPALHAAGHE